VGGWRRSRAPAGRGGAGQRVSCRPARGGGRLCAPRPRRAARARRPRRTSTPAIGGRHSPQRWRAQSANDAGRGAGSRRTASARCGLPARRVGGCGTTIGGHKRRARALLEPLARLLDVAFESERVAGARGEKRAVSRGPRRSQDRGTARDLPRPALADDRDSHRRDAPSGDGGPLGRDSPSCAGRDEESLSLTRLVDEPVDSRGIEAARSTRGRLGRPPTQVVGRAVRSARANTTALREAHAAREMPLVRAGDASDRCGRSPT